ncbi:hypothetical protein ACJMK2_038357 [Sinanodonta woodiana]|uniref:Selenocysteine-specific elongation factor n=1 Tax=Sinanodonta woodiana TaxID=1069815 RepID=A0ABD3WCJ0_SINWO
MAAPTFNFNVGILGHVDSGKTSLSKALSTTASTACFDKNPQSKERGITLDLGFSSFRVEAPAHLDNLQTEGSEIQYTLVDCPGHASLIRTVIGGAQIIDLMILVVDVTKGVQTQTAECLVIGEITCGKMIIALNKVDLLPLDKKDSTIDKMKKRLQKTLENTKFAGCPIVPVAAKPGGTEASDTEGYGLADLIETLKNNTFVPKRNPDGSFIFSVDHCFSIRGQGTVMTGTVLHGSVAVNDNVEIPSLKVTKKIKSIQMFRRPVEKIMQGDRAGICVTQFDPKLLERGTVCTPGALPTIEAAIISVQKIPYFKGTIASKAKFHITSGHDTVMGKVTFFGLYDEHGNSSNRPSSLEETFFDLNKEYKYQDQFLTKSTQSEESTQNGTDIPNQQFALIEFEKPVTCQINSLIIGSKLDTDIHANLCRIAFHGHLLLGIVDAKERETTLPKVKVYKTKVREGQVDRVMDEYTLIGKNLFKKETNIQAFAGLKLTLSSGENGVIEGAFGQSGKIKIRIPNGLSKEVVKKYSVTKKKGKGKATEEESNEEQPSTDFEPIKIFLTFRRYVFDPEKKMRQT